MTLDRIAPLTGQFQAHYHGEGKKKAELANEEQVNAILEDIKTNPFVVTGIRRTEKKRQPAPPLHHLHPSTGGQPEAEHDPPPHHVHRPAAL